jgi:AraC family transcriptional regulator, regulatory protein of adaptative response / methylated-DNA-[protein]-cysteine methyltransferase
MTIAKRTSGAAPSRYWQAVKQRRSAADGSFVYAVRSTGIYCRPSCPSKRPNPGRVVFFSGPREAERAGYRACRRCRPEAPHPQSEAAGLVRRICQKIDEMLATDPEARLTLEQLSRSFGLKPHKTERLFQRILGITPRQFTDAQRMTQLKSKLQKGEKVTAAMYDAGYGSSSRLYERAHGQMGMTPAAYRRGGEGMTIAYTIATSPLGRVLVAATRRGVSAVYLGDSDQPLKKALAKEYPRAEIRQDAAGIGQWVRGILRHLRGREPHIDLPLDVQATAFQRRVWEELQRIPYGSTKSYTEVARAIGKPKAIRAVARACATNPVSIVVPCHRVVREDGNLAGYRWGLERKKTLLSRERAIRDRAKATAIQRTGGTDDAAN